VAEGQSTVQGAAAVTLADATTGGVGTSEIQGAANATTEDASLAAAGDSKVVGQLNVTTEDATVISESDFGSLALPPTNIRVTALNRKVILVRWKENNVPATPLQGVKIERSLDGLGGWTEVGDVAPGIQSFRDSGLTPNTTYWYRVRSYTA
jgi:hypothetical protein